jgi:hypothetical protein
MNRRGSTLLLALTLAAASASGCTTTGDPAPVPPSSTATTPSLSEVLETALTDYCQNEFGAKFTGSGEFTHPTWGQSLLATCLTDDGMVATVLIVDHNGVAQWEKTTIPSTSSAGFTGPGFSSYTPLRPATDMTGNLFVSYEMHNSYDEESHTGIEVLTPTSTGADSASMNVVEWQTAAYNDDPHPPQEFRQLPPVRRCSGPVRCGRPPIPLPNADRP